MPFRDEMSERISKARTVTEGNVYIALPEKEPTKRSPTKATAGCAFYRVSGQHTLVGVFFHGKRTLRKLLTNYGQRW